MEPIEVDLAGVPQTLLGNLGRRAVAARICALNDPLAIQLVERLDYDSADSARGARLHAVRVATFDRALRRFMGSHPAGTVVALGEGLETQFWRVDNGQVHWLTVDLPETMELRHRLLPDGPRQSSHCGSALDLSWIDGLDPAGPIMITAQGLLPYFERDQVHGLIAGIAERLPDSLLVFDAVPEAMSDLLRRASGRERDLAVELWKWLLNRDERSWPRDSGRQARRALSRSNRLHARGALASERSRQTRVWRGASRATSFGLRPARRAARLLRLGDRATVPRPATDASSRHEHQRRWRMRYPRLAASNLTPG